MKLIQPLMLNGIGVKREQSIPSKLESKGQAKNATQEQELEKKVPEIPKLGITEFPAPMPLPTLTLENKEGDSFMTTERTNEVSNQ